MTITIRKNMMKLCLPEEYTTDLFKLSWISIAYTLLVLVPCFILAISIILYLISFKKSHLACHQHCRWSFWGSYFNDNPILNGHRVQEKNY